MRNSIIIKAAVAAAILLTLPGSALGAPPVRTYTHFLCIDPDTGANLGGPGDALTVATSSSAWGTNWPAGCQTISPSSGATVPQGTWGAMTYEVTDPALKIVSAQHWDYMRDLTAEDGFAPAGKGLTVRQHASTQLGSTSSLPVGTDVFSSNTGAFARGNPNNVSSSVNRFDTTVDSNKTRWSVSVICEAPAGCNSGLGPDGWEYTLGGAQVKLSDSKPPVVSQATLSNWHVWRQLYMDTLKATDEGGGVYRVTWTVDGQARQPIIVGNGGDYQCRDVNPSNDDPYEFPMLHPCASSVDTGVFFDIMDISDGVHRFKAQVEDVAGNAVSILDRDIEVDNFMNPQLDTSSGQTFPPSITGAAEIGSQLTAYAGSWVQPNFNEPDHSRAYAWERCDTNGTCTVIPGATSELYTPTADDADYRLRHVVTESNAIGESHTERSAMTDAVPRPGTSSPDPGGDAPGDQTPGGSTPGGQTPGGGTPGGQSPGGGTSGGQTPGGGTPGGQTSPIGPGSNTDPSGGVLPQGAKLSVTFGKSASTRAHWNSKPRATGRLTTASGTPLSGVAVVVQAAEARPGARAKRIGSVTTGADGRFAYAVGHGPSRSVTFSAAGQSATLRTVVSASATLKVSRARTGRTTWLTGHLSHLGRAGIKLEVQALDGHRWRTFDTTTTRKGGSFRYGYKFKPTAAGRRFALRVLVASPVYPFAHGASRAAWVRVKR